MPDPEEPLDPLLVEFVRALARGGVRREAQERRDPALEALEDRLALCAGGTQRDHLRLKGVGRRGGLAFYEALKAYIDASKHFTEVSISCFTVLFDPDRAPESVDEISDHQDAASTELRACHDHVNAILEELLGRPWREAKEVEERGKVAELRRTAEAEAEARGEWIDTGRLIE
jgi:hypothetical protein